MDSLRERLRPWPVTWLVAWTCFCWLTRIPLLWAATNGSDASKLAQSVSIVVFVALAAAALVGVLRSAGGLAGGARTAALVLAVWSAGYWVVRLPFILANHHPVAFDAVHTVLAVVTVSLSVWVLRALAPRRRPAPASEQVPHPVA